MGQAALGIAIPEFGKGLFPLGIGYPELVRAAHADIVRSDHTWIIRPDGPCDNPLTARAQLAGASLTPAQFRRNQAATARLLVQPDAWIEDRVEDVDNQVGDDDAR